MVFVLSFIILLLFFPLTLDFHLLVFYRSKTVIKANQMDTFSFTQGMLSSAATWPGRKGGKELS